MSKNSSRVATVEGILDRGIVKTMLPTRDAVVERLCSPKPARIYIGADPTGPDLHLSHAKNYMLLEEFRRLGHHVIVLFGDFTARIGDPTDRSSSRARLGDAEVTANVEQWMNQIRPIINFVDPVNPARVMMNSEWLSRLSMMELVELASLTTVQRMLERNMFERRIEQGDPVHLHEFLYPLFQGYDSVAMDIDIELCGTDQEFNALVGRTLCARLQDREKLVVEVNLMENPKTGELMSKSNGTGVFLSGDAADLYGQVMALPDEMTEVCLVNVTRIPLDELTEILSGHPRDAKDRLARDLVSTFHGSDAVEGAVNDFRQKFVARSFPADAPVYTLDDSPASALDVALLGAVEKYGSKSAVRRVVEGGGLKIDGVPVQDIDRQIDVPQAGVEVRLGKRVWFRVLGP